MFFDLGYTIRVTEKYQKYRVDIFRDLKIKTRKLRTTQGKRTKSRVPHDPILGHFTLNIRLGSRTNIKNIGLTFLRDLFKIEKHESLM